MRLHPRQDPSRIAAAFPLPPGARIEPPQAGTTLVEFLAGQHLVVGSYSMGLMEARLLGRPALSYQPPDADDGLRREIFAAWDVPVARDDAELAALLAERWQHPGPPLSPEALLFRPGRSLAAIAEQVRELCPSGGRRQPEARRAIVPLGGASAAPMPS